MTSLPARSCGATCGTWCAMPGCGLASTSSCRCDPSTSRPIRRWSYRCSTGYSIHSTSSPTPLTEARCARISREALMSGLRAMPVSSDLQLLWTHAFIDAARKPSDVEWLAGLLDGTTRLEGLAVDFALRWAAVTALATVGAAGPGVIADELERDPTDIGRRGAARARAPRPVPEAKAEAWEAVTGERRLALATKKAVAESFHRPHQESLLAAYVPPHFATLIPFWESHD